MVSSYVFSCILLCICFGFELIKGELITVDALSKMGHSTVQAAIDAVPSNNKNWITIQLKAGVYREQVKIPMDKPFIHLRAEGIGKEYVLWGNPGLLSPTFESLADNIMVSGITFMNSYNYPPKRSKNHVMQAVAAKISGDKSAFYNCSFLGFQDTLWDDHGKHYFFGCYIEGAIDFIFGNGQSIYQSCTISVNIKAIYPAFQGFITAQGRGNPNENTGFVFKQCTITGEGKALLGRPWRDYARVVFYDSFLSDVVVPAGWYAWKSVGKENQLTYVEEQCRGQGSNKSGRVKWEATLPAQALQSLTSMSYIDNEGWVPRLPSPN